MELMLFFQNLCLPAKLYLVILIINLVLVAPILKSSPLKFFSKQDVRIMYTSFIMILLIGLGITIFGNYLCNSGYEFITWIIVLLPILNLIYNSYKYFFSKKRK